MPDILFLSSEDVFKSDIIDQIKHHAPEFNIVEDGALADIIIVDEDIKLLDEYIDDSLKAPVIFLSREDSVDNPNVHHAIIKPFNLSRFLDDIRASINIFENSDDGKFEFNHYVLYPVRKEILNCRNRKITKLTEKEVAIIKYLYKNQGKIVGKNDLMQEVWGYSADATTHTVETHIYRLRQKVEQDDVASQLILTSDGGYQLKV